MSFAPDTGAVELRSYSQYVAQLLAKEGRLDRRQFHEIRQPHIVREEITRTAMNSDAGLLATVMYTDDAGTCVSCAVHGAFGPPRAQRPHEGRLNVRVSAPFVQDAAGTTSVNGLQSTAVMSSAPDLPLLQVEGYVQSLLRAALDLTQLLVYPAEACWVVTVSLTLFNVDGGTRAHALHAAIAALHKLVLPRAQLPNGAIVEPRALRWRCVPVACSFSVLAGPDVRLVADATAIEEHVMDATITIALDEAGKVVHVQQVGHYPLLPAVLMKAIQQWGEQAPAIRAALLA